MRAHLEAQAASLDLEDLSGASLNQPVETVAPEKSNGVAGGLQPGYYKQASQLPEGR